MKIWKWKWKVGIYVFIGSGFFIRVICHTLINAEQVKVYTLYHIHIICKTILCKRTIKCKNRWNINSRFDVVVNQIAFRKLFLLHFLRPYLLLRIFLPRWSNPTIRTSNHEPKCSPNLSFFLDLENLWIYVYDKII